MQVIACVHPVRHFALDILAPTMTFLHFHNFIHWHLNIDFLKLGKTLITPWLYTLLIIINISLIEYFRNAVSRTSIRYLYI